jgi:hypothetical protein
MTCGSCGAAIAQVSGKNGGYYGCLAAKKGVCGNKTLVCRTLAEKIIIGAVSEQINDCQAISCVLNRVEEEVAKLRVDLPETLRLKEAELTAEQRKLGNFVDFIGQGRGSQALGKALAERERRVEGLTDEVDTLRRGREKVFTPPPIEWIAHRINDLTGASENRTARSAKMLRDVLGPIRLAPSHRTSADRSTAHQPLWTRSLSSKQPPQRRMRTAVRLHCESGPYRDRTGDLLRAKRARAGFCLGWMPRLGLFARFTIKPTAGSRSDRGG